jgi:hypothetical protein
VGWLATVVHHTLEQKNFLGRRVLNAASKSKLRLQLIARAVDEAEHKFAAVGQLLALFEALENVKVYLNDGQETHLNAAIEQPNNGLDFLAVVDEDQAANVSSFLLQLTIQSSVIAVHVHWHLRRRRRTVKPFGNFQTSGHHIHVVRRESNHNASAVLDCGMTPIVADLNAELELISSNC